MIFEEDGTRSHATPANDSCHGIALTKDTSLNLANREQCRGITTRAAEIATRLPHDSNETPSVPLPPVAQRILPPRAPRAYTTRRIPHRRPLAPLAIRPPTAEAMILRPVDPAMMSVFPPDSTTPLPLLRFLLPGAD